MWQVRVQKAVVDALGVRRVRLAIGASMGGMVALEWAACFPDFVDELVVIAACGRHTDWAIGIGPTRSFYPVPRLSPAHQDHA